MATTNRNRASAPSSAPPAAAADAPKQPKLDEQPHEHTCPRCGFAGAMKAPPVAPVDVKGATRYRVAKGGTFMWRGSVCNVQTGDFVQRAHYGEAGLQNMRDRGIKLEPVG